MTLADLHSEEAFLLHWHAARFIDDAKGQAKCNTTEGQVLAEFYVLTAEALEEMAAAEERAAMLSWAEENMVSREGA